MNAMLPAVTPADRTRAGVVSGLVAYLSGALAERGVNIVEAFSCFTDTIFLVREKDVMRAYAILSAIVQA